MKIKKDKVLIDIMEYNSMKCTLDNLIDKNNENINIIYHLKYELNKCKKENDILYNKIGNEKRKSYRNRKLFESFIDEVVLPIIDEDMLKKLTNLTYKTFKEVIMKEYDKDIK